MNVIFRADASVVIGTGHVMRCLTLADVLKSRGATCHFICRGDSGHALDFIRMRGHDAHGLPSSDSSPPVLDVSEDATLTRALARGLRPEWLIVDHYSLGQEWECQVRSVARRLFVIDDIGRAHRCDVLLDQNFRNPVHARYRQSLATKTLLLLGSEFALLRPEFATLRTLALQRRTGALTRLLVSMGGTDPGNETSKVLAGLEARWHPEWALDVVVGASNPHLNAVADACERIPNTSLHVQAANMAELMLAADCAISAGGSTTWERCCLGLPALVAVVSDDQLAIADAVAKAGAQILLGWNSALSDRSYAESVAALTPVSLRKMATAAAAICDGRGAERVAERLH
jgi:UDP-2,4-diacetamido-2,4,6-trideoxy-beta-L-altropyranose hydrolase